MTNFGSMDIKGGYVIFLIAGKEYGINVKNLYTIMNPFEDFSLQHSVNIRTDLLKIDDEEVPFINLYDLYNKIPPAKNKDTRIIIFNTEDYKVAFYVEKVIEYISLDKADSLPLKFVSITDQPFVKGKLKYNDRSILFPDFSRILTETTQSP